MFATVTMETPFDLDELLIKLPDAEPILNWVKIKFSPNKNHISIYPSGKILVYGTKSEKELNSLAEDFILYLKKNGINNKIKNIKINNYVLTTKMGFNVDLNNLTIQLSEYDVEYEPEQFPALKFKDKQGITYLLFGNGNITIVGAKSLENLDKYVNEFKNLVCENSSNLSN